LNRKKAGPGKIKDRLQILCPGVRPGHRLSKQKIQGHSALPSEAFIAVATSTYHSK
jgi:hypothetical protein